MRRATVLVLLLLLVGTAAAQQVVPIPAWVRTFSSASLTRGLYFQTPVAMSIVAVRVPDEAKHGKQNAAIYSWRKAPPVWSSAATGGLRFYKGGQSSSLWMPCHVTYNAGDWVGLLGACGDTTIMHNSYGKTNGFVTSIFAKPTTMWRLITQTNLASTQGKGAYGSDNAADIGRVEFQVVPAANLTATGSNAVGGTIKWGLSSPTDQGLRYQVGTSFNLGPIPVDTRNMWVAFDQLLLLSVGGLVPSVFQSYAGNLDKTGSGSAALAIPNIASLKGIGLVTIFVTIRTGAPSNVMSMSGPISFSIK